MKNLARSSPGRGPRASEAIFHATLRLLAERGYPGLTIEGVAESAGVNKTTIYRWWPSKAALVHASVMHAQLLDFAIPDTGSLREDLVALVAAVLDMLTSERAGPVIRAVLGAAAGEPELASLSRDFLADRLRREAPVFTRAVARGELDPAADTMLLADVLGGAIWFRVLFRRLEVSPDFAAHIVDTVLDGFAHPS